MAEGEVEVAVRQMTEDDINIVFVLGGDLISREELLAFELGAPFNWWHCG